VEDAVIITVTLLITQSHDEKLFINRIECLEEKSITFVFDELKSYARRQMFYSFMVNESRE
jgi:hypothetical protein